MVNFDQGRLFRLDCEALDSRTSLRDYRMNYRAFAVMALLTASCIPRATQAQVFDLGPSDSSLFDTVINAPDDVSDFFFDVGDFTGNSAFTTQLNVLEGGVLMFGFIVNSGSEININGGSVGEILIAGPDTEINVIDGVVGNALSANGNTVINISGGTVGDFLIATAGARVNISGGSVGDSITVDGELNISGGSVGAGVIATGQTNISGGSVGADFLALGSVNISGGSVGDNFVAAGETNISGGSVGDAFSGAGEAEVNIFATQVFLDGIELTFLVPDEAFTIDDRDGAVLSGTLADGSAFEFELIEFDVNGDIFPDTDSFCEDATITVTLVMPQPTLAGDFDMDGDVDADDIDFYSGNLDLPASGDLSQLDLNQDGFVTLADHDLHITTLAQTSNGLTGALIGDVNLDGSVDVLNDAFALIGGLGGSVEGYANGDLNADGVINVLGDAFRLIANLGMTNSSP